MTGAKRTPDDHREPFPRWNALRGLGPALAAALLCTLSVDGGVVHEPKLCVSAVPYAGPPLHVPPDSAIFAGADGAMAGALGDSLTSRLDGVISWILANTAAPGITAAVGIPGEGLWSSSRGLARIDPATPFAPRPYFHWASAGKAFTAAVVMQLIEEGKLAYADPLARWFPEFPNAGAITIDHLLVHTSGAFTFNSDLKFRRKRGYSEPRELIRIAARHGNATCPGEAWSYSNTGYVLLARIVERVEGRPFHEVVTRRVIERLGLANTIALAPRQRPGGLAMGHAVGEGGERVRRRLRRVPRRGDPRGRPGGGRRLPAAQGSQGAPRIGESPGSAVAGCFRGLRARRMLWGPPGP